MDDDLLYEGPDEERLLNEIFIPYNLERNRKMNQPNRYFAHYTSAYAATQIIEKGDMWLRNTSVMNDFSEVQHGQNCFNAVLKDAAMARRFQAALNAINPLFEKILFEILTETIPDRLQNTYMASISEHGDGAPSEDKLGRLSMWRAYGGNTNVALIFRSEEFITPRPYLPVYSSPILYAGDHRFKFEFTRVIQNLEKNQEQLSKIPLNIVGAHLHLAIHFAVLSTKHPGFAEELEWRVIYCPGLYKHNPLRKTVETIDGVPQIVYHLDLEDDPAIGKNRMKIKDLLHEVIIGPTQYPQVIKDAMVTKLIDANVPDAWDRVRVSDIPLRR